MKNYQKTFEIAISKTGTPCLWECGGGYTNTGMARIIANVNGKAKAPICVRTHGDLACGNHALIPVRIGDTIVEVERHWDRVKIDVWRIVEIDGARAIAETCLEPIAQAAIEAAVAKSYEYHCRAAYYIR